MNKVVSQSEIEMYYGRNGFRFEFERDVSDVTLNLFDLKGRLVANLYQGPVSRNQTLVWNKKELAGNYIMKYKSSAGDWAQQISAQW